MSLIVRLNIGRKGVGEMEIIRVNNIGLHLKPVSESADVTSSYVVRVDGRRYGVVQHRYGDGAWHLMRKALEILPEAYGAIHDRGRD